MFDVARTNARLLAACEPGTRHSRGSNPFNDSDPAVVGMSAVLKLSSTT
jgi:hypothetical protein